MAGTFEGSLRRGSCQRWLTEDILFRSAYIQQGSLGSNFLRICFFWREILLIDTFLRLCYDIINEAVLGIVS